RRWLLVCEDLDRGGALVRRAMGELLRRKGAALGLRLVATVAPDGHARLGDELAARPARVIHADGPADEAARPDAIEMRRTALSLEEALQREPTAIEELLPPLLSAWQASDQPQRARRWLARALGACNHYGMYEDARRYGEQ